MNLHKITIYYWCIESLYLLKLNGSVSISRSDYCEEKKKKKKLLMESGEGYEERFSISRRFHPFTPMIL